MTTYQDIFNNMDISTIDPSTISSQQDVLATLFPGIPLNSTMIDDWLAEELAKSGVIANSLDFLSGTEKQQQDILSMLPHSPPFSPNSMSDSSSCPKTPCTVSLFPDIAVVKKPAPVVTIMPKTCNLPRIAPRPTTQAVMATAPATPILKRRIMESAVVVDQDEIALKRQKNTDAARRSRLKKLVKMEHLEQRVSELESDNHHLNTRIAVLESEKSGLESKDISLEDRIRVLEAQLSEAHKALTKV
ncbi:hypothetical protein INT48_002078 [Thamnidium elegans]|uniref:BZIP domain-containing protein n=1 Tax=Thamnidium elegans TaxID=101142 RepID=A0A8H7SIT1_9FUNG|nr:hypothetical protein INT48_002078 [Thamnidium elegans]